MYFTNYSRILPGGFSGYDLTGHVTVTQNYPASNRRVVYEYDGVSRLAAFYGNLGNTSFDQYYALAFQYDAAGLMMREKFDTVNGLYHHIKYNNRFQMVEASVGTGSDGSSTGTTVWDRGKLRFFYNSNAKTNNDTSLDGDDNNGNVLRQEHWVPTSVTNKPNSPSIVNFWAVPMRDDYTYDAINRLTRVKGYQQPSGSGGGTFTQIYQQGYDYDKFGNRKLHYSTDSNDEYRTWGNGITGNVTTDLYDVNKPTNRLMGMIYDAAGNLRSAQSSLRFDRRDYDAENRMVYAKTGLNPGNYVYDGDGRRVRRIVNGVETWQVYGIDGELLAEYNATSGSPVLQKEYGYRNGQLLVVAEPAIGQTPAQVKWLVADHLGTPRIIVDSTGSLSNVRRHDYLPFGEELTVGMGGTQGTATPIRSMGMGYEVDGVRQKFTGYERDSESGLDYARARYYSNIQGRFVSPDPLLSSGNPAFPQSWNRYTYCLNNPQVLVDPNGLIWGTKDSEANIKWFKTEADLDNAGYTALNKFVYKVDNIWYAVNPNAEQYKGFSGGREASLQYAAWVGLPSSWVDYLPAVGEFRKLLFSMQTGDSEGALGHFVSTAEEGAGIVLGGAPAAGEIGGAVAARAFATQPGKAVFWNGGAAAKQAAADFAKQIGGKTLANTVGGKFVRITDHLPINNVRLWNWASKHFAQGASGRVNVFLGEAGNSLGTWFTIERPIIMQRGLQVMEQAVRAVP